MFKKLSSLLLVMALLVGLTSVTLAQDVWEMEPWQNYDLEGRTVTFMVSNPLKTPLEPYFEENDNWLDPSPQLEEHIQTVEERFNANIEFVEAVPGEEWLDHFMSGVMAGDPSADVYALSGAEQGKAIEEGAVFPISDIIDYDEYYKRLPPPARSRMIYEDGKSYNMRLYMGPGVARGPSILFNKNIIEEEGLPSPYDLYFEDNWTWETMKELAYAGTKDKNGDGEIDQWGIACVGGIIAWGPRAIEHLRHSNQANWLVIDENGKKKPAIAEPEFMKCIELWKQFKEDNLLPGEGGDARDAPNLNEDILLNISPYLSPEENPHIGIVPLPKGPDVDNYSNVLKPRHFWPRGAGYSPLMPITIENPEAIHELSVALFKSAAPYLPMSFEEWVNQASKNKLENVPDENAAKVMEDFMEATNYPDDMYMTFPTKWDVQDIAHPYILEVFRGEKSVGQAMSEAEAEIESEIKSRD